MFKNVLVGTDGSDTADKAVQAAADLARQLGAQLHIATAYRSTGPGLGEASGAALIESPAVAKEAAESVTEHAASSFGEGLQVTRHSISGHAADGILECAEKVNADLIVVGSKGMHGARRFLGSVPNSVAHGAQCAVLIVKTD